MTSHENLYSGSPSSLSPEYGNYIGYRMNAGSIGLAMNAQTADQLNEAVRAVRQGTKAFEISMLVPDAASYIPEQHFNEIRALMKLTGVKPSIHGPLIDAAGFGERGWEKEQGRELNERRMFDAIKKAHMVDPKGNTPIVFHTNHGVPGKEYRPGDVSKGEERFHIEGAVAINQETGQMAQIKEHKVFRPELPESLDKDAKKGHTITALSGLNSINENEWENKLTELASLNKHAEEIMGNAPLYFEQFTDKYFVKDKDKVFFVDPKTNQAIEGTKDHENAYNRLHKADIFIENVKLNFNSNFEKAFKYGSEKQREELKKLSEEYSKKYKEIEKEPYRVDYVLEKKKLLDESTQKLWGITQARPDSNGKLDPNYGAPKIFMEVEDFAKEKAAQTFSNLAIQSYKEFGKNAPTMVIENWQPGLAFARAEDMKKLIEETRKKFAEDLQKEGINKEEAKEISKKQIGMTWDLGRINLWKKYGFTDKDIIEETKLISKDKSLVKHIHLADNFGYHDSHLAPGMGSSPIKGMLEELEKTGRLKEMRKILEAGGYAAQFKKSPWPLTLEAFGSPIYGMKTAPFWNQSIGMMGDYFSGYGETNPQIHHSIYGSGFSGMPTTFGGQIGNQQSRFGGTPMA